MVVRNEARGTFWNVFKNCSLEISAFLFMTSVLMTYLISQDFLMNRVCRASFGYSEAVCRDIVSNTGNYTKEENAIQKEMTHIRKIRSMLDYTIPVIFVIFQGSWSDIYGRKLPLILPCIGFFFQAMTFFMCHYFEHLNALRIVIVSAIVKSLSGADVTFRIAAISHISDISSDEERTVRTGLMTAAFTVGVPAGFAMGGAVLKARIEPHVAFLISAAICATAFFIIFIFLDNRAKSEKDAVNENEQKFFTWDNVKSVLKSLLMNFDGVSRSGRIQIIVLIIAIICVNAPIQGEFGVMYLYLRKKLSWDISDYGIFSTYVSLVGVGGTVLSMGVLCNLMKLSDAAIGVIAGLSQFGGCFMYAFAYNDLMIYLAPSIDMLNGTMSVIAKSMLSKLCPPQDFGKMFSFIAVIELIVPLVFDPTYSTIYEHTIHSFPGAVFLLSAALTVPPQLTYLFYLWKDRKVISCEITQPQQIEKLDSKFESGNVNNSKPLASLSSENYFEFLKSNNVTLNAAHSTMTVDSIIC